MSGNSALDSGVRPALATAAPPDAFSTVVISNERATAVTVRDAQPAGTRRGRRRIGRVDELPAFDLGSDPGRQLDQDFEAHLRRVPYADSRRGFFFGSFFFDPPSLSEADASPGLTGRTGAPSSTISLVMT